MGHLPDIGAIHGAYLKWQLADATVYEEHRAVLILDAKTTDDNAVHIVWQLMADTSVADYLPTGEPRVAVFQPDALRLTSHPSLIDWRSLNDGQCVVTLLTEQVVGVYQPRDPACNSIGILRDYALKRVASLAAHRQGEHTKRGPGNTPAAVGNAATNYVTVAVARNITDYEDDRIPAPVDIATTPGGYTPQLLQRLDELAADYAARAYREAVVTAESRRVLVVLGATNDAAKITRGIRAWAKRGGPAHGPADSEVERLTVAVLAWKLASSPASETDRITGWAITAAEWAAGEHMGHHLNTQAAQHLD